MKKVLFSLLTSLVLLLTTSSALYAQILTPAPTKEAQPTTAPTAKPTSVPAPTAKPTEEPRPTQNANNSPTPTAGSPTPTINSTPTPTIAPKVVTAHIKPPLPPNSPVNKVADFIAYPFALASNILPGNFYQDDRLSPIVTKTFLIFAFLCISSGSLLLAWPNLRKYVKHYGISYRKEEQIPYIAR